jgi:transposase
MPRHRKRQATKKDSPKQGPLIVQVDMDEDEEEKVKTYEAPPNPYLRNRRRLTKEAVELFQHMNWCMTHHAAQIDLAKKQETIAFLTDFSLNSVSRGLNPKKDYKSVTEKVQRKKGSRFTSAHVALMRDVVVTSLIEKKSYATIDTLYAAFCERCGSEDIEVPCKRAYFARKLQSKTSGLVYDVPNTFRDDAHHQEDVILYRCGYIERIRRYRHEGRPIVWQDETWYNQNDAVKKLWQLDPKNPVNADVNFDRLRTGHKSGKGSRWILSHVGGCLSRGYDASGNDISQYGFVKGALLLFHGQKGNESSDYHTEMNSHVFCKYLREKVLPNLPDRCVLVLDNAKYHTALHEDFKHPRIADKKAKIVQWIKDHQVLLFDPRTPHATFTLSPDAHKVPSYMTKIYLMERVEEHVSRHKMKEKLQVDLLVEEENKKIHGRDIILEWLPVQHCELNPIEMVWAAVKMRIRKMNMTMRKRDMDIAAYRIFPDEQQSIDGIAEAEAVFQKKLENAQKKQKDKIAKEQAETHKRLADLASEEKELYEYLISVQDEVWPFASFIASDTGSGHSCPMTTFLGLVKTGFQGDFSCQRLDFGLKPPIQPSDQRSGQGPQSYSFPKLGGKINSKFFTFSNKKKTKNFPCLLKKNKPKHQATLMTLTLVRMSLLLVLL